MGMSITLKEFLDGSGFNYDMVDHPHRVTTRSIADSAHITAEGLAKAVLLHDGEDYVIAVLAGSHMVDLAKMRSLTGRDMTMARGDQIGAIFRDCDLGAIPPVGAAYGMDVMIDEGLNGRPDVYFEAGDHRQLVHMAGADFDRLMANAKHGDFSQRQPSTP